LLPFGIYNLAIWHQLLDRHPQKQVERWNTSEQRRKL
jgi:hypothetical protein